LERIVFRLTEVSVPSYTPTEDDPYASEIAGGLSDDLIGQYIGQLQDQLGVSINQQALRRALGETDEF
jgi:peptidyl-prolyl cis-trans isomerase D